VSGTTALAVWLVIAVLLLGVEMMTLAFIALYLAAGAIGAAIAGAAGGNLAIQIVVFAVVSIVSLVLTRRPLMRLMARTPQVVSNALTVVGKRGQMTVPIAEGPSQRGQVRIGTEFWSASSIDEHAIAEGETVAVTAIEGVTARVERVETPAVVVPQPATSEPATSEPA
jgi:membrane protein implicated in regulation of membrane protease activity